MKPVQLSKYASSGKKQQLIPPGSLGTLTKATYDRLKQQPQHRRMGPTTSALVRPSPLFSRPPPGAALRVMPPKKRVKLDEDDDSNVVDTKNNMNNKNDIKKTDATIKHNNKPNVFLNNPYMKGGKEKLDERNRRESQRKQMPVPTNKAKLPPANMLRLPEATKTTIDKNKKSMAKASRAISRAAITPRASSITPRASLSQRSQLTTQRAQLQQRTQLQQRSPLSHRSPLPQRSPLPPRSSIPQRSPLPQRTSLSQKATNRNVFSIKRNHQLSSQKRQPNNNVHERESENMEQTKQPTFLGVKFKRMKKANLADQIKRSKEGKLDLMTPDSILTSVHIKDLLNEDTFATLPPAYQYQLLMLLPKCDREVASDGALRLSQHALNNEFFTRSCQEFKDKLMDGEFNSDIIQRAKNEVELNMRLDPWKVKYFEPAYGVCSSFDTSKEVKDTKKKGPPPRLQVVESSWVAFLKFSENSTDDFEEALNKMQVAVKTAAQQGEHVKDVKGSDERRTKREESIRPNDFPTRTSLAQNRCTTFRSPNTLKPKGIMRGETATKEKSRKALKKAQLLQRKKALDKQLKDAKAKIVEEARSSCRKDDDSITTNLLKSKILNKSFECNVDIKRLPNNIENELNTHHQMSNITSFGSSLYNTSLHSNNTMESNTSMESNNCENENSQVINLCDNMALKKLIKNSDIIKQNNDIIKQNNDIIKPINNFVTQLKRGPKKRTGSRILKGPSSFLTHSDGSCACKLKAMVMCIQCESYWHGDSINGEQLCFLCT